MNSQILATVIEALIVSAIGVGATLYGFGWLGRGPALHPLEDDSQRGRRKLFRAIGPVLIAVPIIMALTRVLSLSGREDVSRWERFTTSDGVCSAEFPAKPKAEVQRPFGVESKQLTLSRNNGAVYYMLTYSDIPPDAGELSPQERLDAIRDSIPTMGKNKGLNYELVREQRIEENGVPGRQLEFAATGNNTFQTRVFVLGQRLYRVIAVTPTSRKGHDETRRFLTSLRFDLGKK
jgi:hypothetical protein